MAPIRDWTGAIYLSHKANQRISPPRLTQTHLWICRNLVGKILKIVYPPSETAYYGKLHASKPLASAAWRQADEEPRASERVGCGKSNNPRFLLQHEFEQNNTLSYTALLTMNTRSGIFGTHKRPLCFKEKLMTIIQNRRGYLFTWCLKLLFIITTDPLRGSYCCCISPHAAFTIVRLRGVYHNRPSPTAHSAPTYWLSPLNFYGTTPLARNKG